MLGHDVSLHGQFLLAEHLIQTPKGWTEHALGDWHLAVAPGLPVVRIEDEHGGPVGWLLGWAAAGGDLLRRLSLPVRTQPVARVETLLYAMGGRWAAALVTGPLRRMYLDAGGTLATVFRTDQRRIGSTPTSVMLDDLPAFYREQETRPPLPPNAYLPAGLTGDARVRRLLPNHTLDLTTWAVRRHWPDRPTTLLKPKQEADASRQVAATIGMTIEAFARHHLLEAGITAGRDSRMVLACSANVLDRFRGFTFDYADPEKAGDPDIAADLAHTLGVPHLTVPLTAATHEQRAAFLRQTGFVSNAGKAGDLNAACRRHCDLGRVLLMGFFGEIGRAIYWDRDIPARRPDAPGLAARLKQAATPENLAALDVWLAGVPDFVEVPELLDLAYQELRVGCWAAPQMYGYAPFTAVVAPMTHRLAAETFTSWPRERRQNCQAFIDMIHNACPRLAAVPFKQPRPRPPEPSILSRVRKKFGGHRIIAA